MKHMIKLMALTAFIPVAVLAQSASLDEEVNAELDRMYREQPAGAPAAQSARAGGANVQVNVGQAVEQKTQTITTQKQPLTVIQATPISESNADRMRKARQEQEVQTEQKIVEKLEQSRLDDEKRRSETLFGDRFNQLMQQQQAVQQTQAVAPAVVGDNNAVTVTTQQAAQPVAVIPEPKIEKVDSEEKARLDREAIRGEVTAALNEMKPREEEKKDSSYVSGILGAADYPDARNVRGQYTVGVAYGKKFNDRTVVEGSYMYSNFQVEQRDGGCFFDAYYGTTCYPRITEMNQHQTSVLAKYQLLSGTFRPEVGVLGSYTYRTFSDTQFALSNDSVSSQALDIGLMTGISLELSSHFSLGFDFRYMQNLSNKVDSKFQKSYVQPYLRSDKPIETLSYYTMGLVLRSTF